MIISSVLSLTLIWRLACAIEDAGLGMEFESAGIMLVADDCSQQDLVDSTQKVIGNRKGDHWQLTGDTVDGDFITAEYILDGRAIKLRSGKLAEVAAEADQDFSDWKPGADAPDGQDVVEIADAKCNPWKIIAPEKRAEATGLKFAPQITAPMPLEAIQEYFEVCFTSEPAKDGSVLLPSDPFRRRGAKALQKVWVTENFFQSSPDGFKTSDKAVLGFFSLILSYIKGVEFLEENSPKELSSIMPRTDFHNMYLQVRDKITNTSGRLYDIVKVLVCLKTPMKMGEG